MKKVLLITFNFSDRRAIGSIRSNGLATFLPEFGWEPVILTAKSQTRPDSMFNVIETPFEYPEFKLKEKFGFKIDKSIKEQVGVSVYKNKKTFMDFIPFLWEEFFAYPDKFNGWYQFAVKAGNELLKKESFDAIISSSSPVTSHIVAKELKSEYGISWVADLRDLWTQNHYYSRSSLRKLVERKLELKTLAKADALVTTSAPLADKLKILHKKTVYSITNGFSHNEVDHLNLGLTRKFTITYTGALYRGKRDPSKLFKVIQDLISKKIVNPDDIEIRFYGVRENWLENEIRSYGLQNIAKWYGYVDRTTALEKQTESQLLLLLLWNHPEENRIIPGKIFDYFAVKRPILGIGGSGGIVKKLLDETNAGIFAISSEEINNFIRNSYNEWKWKGEISYKGKISEINKYTHREMSKKFAKVLEFITNRTTSN